MKIKISDIENKEKKVQEVSFSEIFDEFNKNIPVKAELKIGVTGSLIKISGEINALLNLTCDVCLEEFTKEINIKVEEYYTKYSLNDNNYKEFEIKQNSFIEDLNGTDEIDLTDFVYQSVILHIPNKLVCGINCKGNENVKKYLKTEISDSRMEIFKAIKTEKE